MDYFQPEFYHFSEDSTTLANYIVNEIKKAGIRPMRSLDMCAGCGVVGLEIMRALRDKKMLFHFLELQDEFKDFFDRNVSRLREEIGGKTEFIKTSYVKLKDPKYKHQYDLIVCNPPFFDVANNRLGSDSRRNTCRFFTEGDIIDLLEAISNSLKAKGRAYFLSRLLEKDLKAILMSLNSKSFLKMEKSIGGANLFQLFHS